jgi:hypothetical protein
MLIELVGQKHWCYSNSTLEYKTQSVESFNSIIKKSLNNASTLCDIEEAIDKRHKEEEINKYQVITYDN